MKRIFIVPGRNSEDLARRIAKQSGHQLAEIKWSNFSDGECKPQYKDNIRGAELYIINSTNAPDSNLKDILLLTDAAIRSSAERVIAVVPYFGGQRQERKDRGRVPITAMLNVNLLAAAGIYKIVAMDLHADAIQAFFPRFDNIYASYIFVPYIQNLQLKNLYFVATDTGGGKRTEKYANYFDVDFGICYKQRGDEPNSIKKIRLLGNATGKNVIIIDDMVDTASSIESCINLLKLEKAKSIRCVFTHAVLSGNAYQRIQSMQDVEFIVTDTIPIKPECLSLPNFKVLRTDKLFAEVIRRDVNKESISSLFVF
jgi:ribose-phosphate pyrophosphokinase